MDAKTEELNARTSELESTRREARVLAAALDVKTNTLSAGPSVRSRAASMCVLCYLDDNDLVGDVGNYYTFDIYIPTLMIREKHAFH